MLDFLRMLAPQHTDALRPASALRRPAMSEAQPSDAAQPFVDDASQIPPSRAALSSRVTGLAAMADRATQTTSEPGVAQRPQQAAMTSAEIDAGARTTAPTSDMGTSWSDHAGPVEHAPAFAQQATTRRQTASPTSVDPRSKPVPSPQQSPCSELLPDRVDRTSLRNQTPASRPPLSPTTVALYATPSNERDAAPAIHVTIDRIEVRAPAPTSRVAPGKRREPAHTQTLGDYLRGNSKVTQ